MAFYCQTLERAWLPHVESAQVPHLAETNMAEESIKARCAGRTACGNYAGCVTHMVPGIWHTTSEGAAPAAPSATCEAQ